MTLRTSHLDCTVPHDLPENSHYGRFHRLSSVLNAVCHDILFDVVFSNPTASADEISSTVAALVRETLVAEWGGPNDDPGQRVECDTKNIRDRYVARLSEYEAARAQAVAFRETFAARVKADLDEFRRGGS